jgi:hypothetical protein
VKVTTPFGSDKTKELRKKKMHNKDIKVAYLQL